MVQIVWFKILTRHNFVLFNRLGGGARLCYQNPVDLLEFAKIIRKGSPRPFLLFTKSMGIATDSNSPNLPLSIES